MAIVKTPCEVTLNTSELAKVIVGAKFTVVWALILIISLLLKLIAGEKTIELDEERFAVTFPESAVVAPMLSAPVDVTLSTSEPCMVIDTGILMLPADVMLMVADDRVLVTFDTVSVLAGVLSDNVKLPPPGPKYRSVPICADGELIVIVPPD